MSKKIGNLYAQRTETQINSTLNTLMQKRLCITYNPVRLVMDQQYRCQITWNGHVSGRANSGDSFMKLIQYHHILKTNSYHCLLFDGSLIRVNFVFENELLLTQNLLWWPAPYDYRNLLQDGFAPIDLLEDFYGDQEWHQNIRMRSPVRIDFDCNNNKRDHPHSHLHIQHEETRIYTGSPICFNRFIDFIFRNFYPEFTFSFSQYDFINYKLPDLETIDYLFSKVTI